MWCSGGSGQILECSGKRSPLEPSSVCLLIHLSACLLLDPVLRCSSLSLSLFLSLNFSDAGCLLHRGTSKNLEEEMVHPHRQLSVLL